MRETRPKVVVAMSGGVDSSVAAALLQRQGYDCVGVFMRLGTPKGVDEPESCDLTPAAATSEGSQPARGKSISLPIGEAKATREPKAGKQGCCSVLDATDARRVAGLLDMPFYVLNFEDGFGQIIEYFMSEYNAGRTPNPCVRCNDWLKFGRLHQYAEAVGAQYVASGHYARIETDAAGNPTLMRGLDHDKDQSYVLFGIGPDTLRKTLLPIGGYRKSEVRALAEELDLPTFNKPDSQEICFVPDQDYAGLLRRRNPEAFNVGEFVDATGKVVGTHEGHQHFTIGQRKGLGLAMGKPVYVTQIDAENNRVQIGEKADLMMQGVEASQLNVLADVPLDIPLRCEAKIRYNHDPAPATLTRTGDDALQIVFDEPQSAITPGQAAVCYRDNRVICGGWIDRAFSVT